MKNAIIFLIISSTVFLMLSCKEDIKKEKISFIKKENGTISKITFFDNDNINTKSQFKIYNNDTLYHGIHEEYFIDGQLKLKSHYKDGYLEGMQYGYFESGSIRFKGNRKRGQRHGVWKWYYEDVENNTNLLSQKMYLFKDSLASHQFSYHKNQIVSTYSLEAPWLSGYVYLSEYDNEGNLIMEDGEKKPLNLISTQSKNIHKYNIGDTLYVFIYHVKPPNTEFAVYAKIENIHEDWVNIPIPNDFYQPVELFYILNKEGSFIFKSKLVLKEKDKISEYIMPLEFEVFSNNFPSLQ